MTETISRQRPIYITPVSVTFTDIGDPTIRTQTVYRADMGGTVNTAWGGTRQEAIVNLLNKGER